MVSLGLAFRTAGTKRRKSTVTNMVVETLNNINPGYIGGAGGLGLIGLTSRDVPLDLPGEGNFISPP